jgi:hypothetical protein
LRWEYAKRGQQDVTSGLVGWWKFNGDAPDSVGTNTGTAASVVWTNGVAGQAAAFDGTASTILLPPSTQITGLTYSVTAWAYIASAMDSDGVFFSNGTTADTVIDSLGFRAKYFSWNFNGDGTYKSAADYFQGSFRCKTPNAKDGKESVIVFDYSPERFVSVVYQHCERVSNPTKPVNNIISQWLEVSEVYDYTGNQWNLMTGEDISQRFLSDINNYMDRVGQAIDPVAITNKIILLLQNKEKDANQTSATSQLNLNGVLTGSNKKRVFSSGVPASGWRKPVDPVVAAEQQIRYALKQIFKLIDVGWADNMSFTNLTDIITCKDIRLVAEITGLKPNEWKEILPAVNQITINRAMGQYNDFQ